MVEVTIFTVVVACPGAPSVVVLAEKSAVAHMLGVSSARDAQHLQGGSSRSSKRATPTAIGQTTPLPHSDRPAASEPHLLPIWIGHSEAEIIMQLYENGSEFLQRIKHGVKEISSLLLESLRTQILTDEDIKNLGMPIQIRFA